VKVQSLHLLLKNLQGYRIAISGTYYRNRKTKPVEVYRSVVTEAKINAS